MRPILGGVTLPYPTEFNVEREVMGGSQRMASGAVSHTVVRDDRRSFEMKFELLTAAEISTVEDAWETIQQDAVSFTTVDNETYTVKRHPDQKSLRLDKKPARNGAIWVTSCSLKVLEVLADE